MMIFTKIAIFLLVVAGVTLAAFGSQIRQSVFQEESIAMSPSPSPYINYLVGAYQEAKSIQNVHDTRFSSNAVLSINEITSLQTPKGSYDVSGYVVSENTCPPCPKGSVGLCSPCPPDTITISEVNNDQLVVRANSNNKVTVGQNYIFTISGDVASGWDLIYAKSQ